MKSDIKGAMKGMLGSVAASAMGMRCDSEGSQDRGVRGGGSEESA